MSDITIYEIKEADWINLRDYLAATGWSVERGGGFDHSWASLSVKNLQISMEYDTWGEGKVSFDANQKNEILMQMPKQFIKNYCNIFG